jgi:DNA-binding CsgD family transcriptional regulator
LRKCTLPTESSTARTLLRSAIRQSSRFHFSWRLALQAALLCEAADVAEIEAFVEGAPEAREPMSQAYAELVSASLTGRASSPLAGAELARSAARRFAQLRCPQYEARALELAGEPYPALAIYERIGNARDARRMRRDLHLETRAVTSPLTARQREVAAILVKGASNREIAGRLSITVNTVEHHVSEILSRLGVSSRAKLAARLLNPAGDLQQWVG